ncbi:MAG: M24 family metallopeptidase [Acidimicrobiales bacterium]
MQNLSPSSKFGDLPSMGHDGQRRIQRLRSAFDQQGLTALYLVDLANIRYLTGFTGSFARLVVPLKDQEITLITDGRYVEQASSELADQGLGDAYRILPVSERDSILQSLLGGTGHLGAEGHAITWDELEGLSSTIGPGRIERVENATLKLRATKDNFELGLLAHAAVIADAALSRVLPLLGQSPTEREFARSLEAAMFDEGATAISFPTIIASGPRSSLPHGQPTERRLVPGDVVVVDFGAEYLGYHSDCTRTFSIGEPSDEVTHAYQAVSSAQRQGVEASVTGASISQVDRLVRSVLDEAGLVDRFIHGLGHGVGLEIHELPMISSNEVQVLSQNQVITIEPGVYLPNAFGIRIEDSLIVRDGEPLVITKAPKDWVIAI